MLIESMMEYVLEENEEEELILATKYEYFYENENCSGDISFQMISNYSLVKVDKQRNEYILYYLTYFDSYYFDITTLSQLITFNNDYYLKQHECTNVIKTRVTYFATSSILYFIVFFLNMLEMLLVKKDLMIYEIFINLLKQKLQFV